MAVRKYTYRPTGACCTQIDIELMDNVVADVRFSHGCAGNHKAIEALVRGQKVQRVIKTLEGIQCRNGTSCPDQLAKALRAALTNFLQPDR